ncbi:MAG: hypothetical protein ROO76_22515 [Terriglobia bacterium]|nr:hypothetical protein [Terriglobia bacterium]
MRFTEQKLTMAEAASVAGYPDKLLQDALAKNTLQGCGVKDARLGRWFFSPSDALGLTVAALLAPQLKLSERFHVAGIVAEHVETHIDESGELNGPAEMTMVFGGVWPELLPEVSTPPEVDELRQQYRPFVVVPVKMILKRVLARIAKLSQEG